MSNDHIFAAQMWSWADPMIKRDSHGRILVVNAAFLQLYGGSVETWTGNPIGGWPVPKSPGESSRFESRIPLPTGGETVYDWMECTHQDGTAVAMARDVSVYAAAANIQAPPAAPEAPQEIVQTQEPVTQAQMQDDLAALSPLAKTAPPSAQAPVQTPEQTSVQAEAPAQANPSAAMAVAATAVVATAPAIAAALPEVTPQAPVETVAAAPVTPAQEPASVMPAPVETVAEAPPVQQNPIQQAQDDRAFEKRALPIEDGDAILGNNWRDAVIAKAVGVEDSGKGIADDATANENTMSNENGEQIKVLLAEDNAINALLTRTLLEAEGCLCDVVEDGALAVEAVKNNEYDLVFMDMRMPNMDGLEATRKIRAMGYNAKSFPIVALTANAFDDDRNACFDSGMNDFMTKPVSAEELSAMVKTHTSLDIEKLAS